MLEIKKLTKSLLLLLLTLSFSAQIVFAVAPSEEVVAKWKQDGVYEQRMEILHDFHKRGGCSPVEHAQLKKNNFLASGVNVVDTIRVLVLMVDFSDHPMDAGLNGTKLDFDSILFSENFHNPTGSMTDYYLENSYGNFYIQGEIFGTYRMPQTYAYYTNGESGLGSYPQNAQTMVNDAVSMADSAVDFSRYDFNNDNICDGVILIHSGPGAELTGSGDDIWSHKWNLANHRILDGVDVYNYNMNPEEYGFGAGAELSPIGVFCHEYGHFLGLPDLYDTNPLNTNSEGLGRWSLMASGNYNGDSKVPAHFDPWSKSELGFINLIDVTDNLYNQEIPQIETSPVAYKLYNASGSTTEYFIVENRQRVGFDLFLPSEGMLIYHIDDTKSTNTNFLNYKVALEQADGLDQLAFAGSNGDAGDPFPGASTNRNFSHYDFPNSDYYNGFESQLSVWNITASDSLMYADLDVTYSRPKIEPIGVNPFVMSDADGDGYLEAGETITFNFSIINRMRPTENVHATLSSNNSGLQFTQNNVTILGTFNAALFDNPSNPIEFIVPDTLTPHIDSFFLTIVTDSLDASNQPIAGSATHTEVLGFEVTLGRPNIVIVDGDRGAALEQELNNALYEKRVPADIWDINNSGTPTLADLTAYDMVLWHTGDSVGAGQAITVADISIMKQLMDNGKHVMLSTLTGVDDIWALDSLFLINYFHARKDVGIKWPILTGVSGNPVGDGLEVVPVLTKFYTTPTLAPAGSGLPSFTANSQVVGVTYEGTYKSALFSFAVEYIDDNRSSQNTKADLIASVVDFFGGVSTDIYDGNPFAQIPSSFVLNQNYPNPFNPSTTIQYTIRPTKELGAITTLEVFNMLGQRVVTLVDKAQIPGNYAVQWDGTNAANQEVASGIYFYRLARGSEVVSKKMNLLK